MDELFGAQAPKCSSREGGHGGMPHGHGEPRR